MRNLEKGQHIFIAFQNGKAVLDSQLRPRIYTSLENADKWTPTVNKGKIEYVEYAPTLTPQNEWVSVEERLPEPGDLIVYADNTVWGYQYGICRVCGKEKAFDYWMPLQDPPNNRPPEGET